MLFRQRGEICAVGNLLFELIALRFGAYENVSCCGLGHN
jgi:hypothetical protein